MDKEPGRLDWSKDAVLKMIQMWKKHECLYNPKHVFYHNRRARYDTLKQMSEELKVYNELMGASDVKNKMTYLRGQYTREVAKAKERKNGAGGEEVYAPVPYWYKELSFLKDFLKIRKGGCNLDEENSVQTEEWLDSSVLVEAEISPEQMSKRPRVSCETPQTSRSMSQEESVLTAATTILQNMASNPKKAEVDVKDKAFCNYIKAELNTIKNVQIKDELFERITLAVFDAKKKQRMADETDFNFHNFD